MFYSDFNRMCLEMELLKTTIDKMATLLCNKINLFCKYLLQVIKSCLVQKS